MHAIAEFTVIPIGVGVSLSRYVAVCEQVLQASGLSYELHANGTNIEGEWDDVLQVIKTCHEKLHQMDVPRIATQIKIGTRTDRAQRMQDKVHSVEAALGKRKENHESDVVARIGKPELETDIIPAGESPQPGTGP